MAKRLLAVLIASSLLLSGCSSMLARDYASVTAHNMAQTAEGDPSVLRADSYQELVNALLYLVTQGAESGAVRLYLDSDNVSGALEDACQEVQEDPLGAYAVDYIKYSVGSVVTYYQADVQITYRRTREQIASLVSATGTAAIRSELENALDSFAPECVLRISYFEGDEEYIRSLFQEAYYATPAAALDMPDISISIYPDSGRQRIVEILLSYHLDAQELSSRKELLGQQCQALLQTIWPLTGDQRILACADAVARLCRYDPSAGSTAYHALLEGSADSEGMALAMALLCQELGVEFQVVSGTLEGEPRFWTVVSTQEGWRHLDPSRSAEQENPLYSDDQMEAAGYIWDRDAVPACTAPEQDAG